MEGHCKRWEECMNSCGHLQTPPTGPEEPCDQQERPGHHREHTSEDDPMSERNLHHPVDRGWAWVILLAVFVIQFVSAGFMRALGVLFVAIQSVFQSSASMIAVIGGVVSAAFSVTAVFCMSVLLDVISVRRCTLIGALVGTCGLVSSFFASTTTTLIFSFSVCLGIGMGMSMAPGYILLNVYFKKKRPLATALANTGSSIGSVVMPMVTRMLLDQYFLSGTLLLLGGVYAQILIFGALFTPPSDYGHRDYDQRKADQYPTASSSKDDMKLKWERLRSLQSKDTLQRPVSEMRSMEKDLNKDDGWSAMEPLTKSLPAINGQQFHHRLHQLTGAEWRDSWKERLSMETLVRAACMTGSNVASLTTLNTSISNKDSGFRSSLFISQLKTSEQNGEDSSQESDDDISDCSRLSEFKTCSVCDPNLYRSAVFWLLACYHFTGSLVCSLPSAYLPALAEEKGLTLTQGALLLTICGSLDIISRLVPGILAQSDLVKPQISVAVAMLVLGVTFQLTAVVEGMVGLIVISVVYGLFSGVFFSMLQIIILDFSDLSKFRQVFSITQLALGGSGVTGYLIVGYLRDISGSYVTSFHFMGTCGLLASALLLLMPAVQRREVRRQGSPPMLDVVNYS